MAVGVRSARGARGRQGRVGARGGARSARAIHEQHHALVREVEHARAAAARARVARALALLPLALGAAAAAVGPGAHERAAEQADGGLERRRVAVDAAAPVQLGGERREVGRHHVQLQHRRAAREQRAWQRHGRRARGGPPLEQRERRLGAQRVTRSDAAQPGGWRAAAGEREGRRARRKLGGARGVQQQLAHGRGVLHGDDECTPAKATAREHTRRVTVLSAVLTTPFFVLFFF